MRIVLFGTGKGFAEIQQKNLLYPHEVVAILDNNLQKQGTTIICNERAMAIVAPDMVNVYTYDAVLITMQKFEYQCEAGEQLSSLGVSEEKIYVLNGNRLIPRIPMILTHKVDMGHPLYYDVSTISRRDWGAGIPRVVNNVYRELSRELKTSICPVRHMKGNFITSRLYQTKMDEEEFDNIEYEVVFNAHDCILCMDILKSATEIEPYIQKVATCGCRIYGMIYDILPLRHPTWFQPDGRRMFETWLLFLLTYAEGILCSAQAVVDDIADYYLASPIKRKQPLNLFHVHLGFEINKASGMARDSLRRFVLQRKTFLMVGTVQIRKNHFLVAKVLRDLLLRYPQTDIQLLVIGHNGWDNEDFIELLSTDSILQDRVLWIQDATDAELQWAYQHTEALIFASMGEGFGLPTVEAAYFGLPLLLSDIPVFREVAGDCATYFQVNNEASLKDAILQHLENKEHPDSRKIRLYTWKESAQEILDIVKGKTEPCKSLIK